MVVNASLIYDFLGCDDLVKCYFISCYLYFYWLFLCHISLICISSNSSVRVRCAGFGAISEGCFSTEQSPAGITSQMVFMQFFGFTF